MSSFVWARDKFFPSCSLAYLSADPAKDTAAKTLIVAITRIMNICIFFIFMDTPILLMGRLSCVQKNTPHLGFY